jgi:N6-L-threonylcarbamoyladenine synthase
MKQPLILAIDTSCDETAVAVTSGQTVLSNVIASQAQLHKQYGGVFPTVAKQAHAENLPATVNEALKRARKTWADIDAIAVTQGPGLAPALEVGLRYAEELSERYSKNAIPINHIEGHVLSVLAQPSSRTNRLTHHSARQSTVPVTPPHFPALSVIVSGGHTEFVLVEKIGAYKRLGVTVDDAAGECLDKVGRLLGLGYPAGPVVEQLAKRGSKTAFPFPKPMTAVKTFDMSFSGIKTHSRQLIDRLEKSSKLNKQTIADFCACLQEGVFEHIIYKLTRLLEKIPVNELWLGGGVAANGELRKKLRAFAKKHRLTFRTPYSKKLTGDNAAMIGVAASYTAQRPNWEKNAATDLDRKPQWHIAV